jgi:hypothetical protein
MCSRSTMMTECGCVWAKTQFTSTVAMAMVRHGACSIISTSVKPCCCPWKNQSQSLTRSSRKPLWGNCQKFLTRMGMYSCYDVLSWLMYIGNNNRFMYFKILVVRGEASTSAHCSIYVIVNLLDDGQHKRPKYVVEDKWMHSVWSFVFWKQKLLSISKHNEIIIH